MTITTDLGGKNYVLGRGRVFFDRFASGATVTGTTRGEGERYIGNTPEVSTTTSSEKFEHYDSEAGVKTKDLTILLSTNRTGKFTTDNINAANLALFFLGDAATLTQTSATAVVEVISGAKRDRFYQLGVTTALPAACVRSATSS
jgi:autotransporter adhesin